MVFSRVGEHHQLFPNQVVEGVLRTEASSDPLRRSALLSPDPFEAHARNIALTTGYVQSSGIAPLVKYFERETA